jgi:hypothetical protein
MTLLLTGAVALLLAFVAIGYLLRAKHSLITHGIAGLIAGFMLGYSLAAIVQGSHFFGPVRIPDPIIQFGGVATMLSMLYAPLLAVAGLIVGCLLGWRKRTKP